MNEIEELSHRLGLRLNSGPVARRNQRVDEMKNIF